MNNLFSRLSAGQDWFENAYSEENFQEQAQKQARQFAKDQVTAVQNQASDLLRQKIGDDAVEAAVGLGAIAYPYFKGALGMDQGTAGVGDKVSDAVGDVSQKVREGFRSATQDARFQARQVADAANKQIADAAGQFNEKAGVLERIQQNIKSKQDAVKNFDPELANIPEEVQLPLQTTASRLDALSASTPPVPRGSVPTGGDIPSVSVPAGEFRARAAARQSLRERAEQEFGAEPGETDLKPIPEPPAPKEAGIYDPFSLKPRQLQDPGGGFAGVSGDVEVEEGGDLYDDMATQARLSAERFNLPTIEDFKKADARREAAEAERRAQTVQPDTQPIPDEPIGPTFPPGYVPPSEQTGGLDPSKLPEGAGFQRGGAKIPAQRPAGPPVQQRGLQEQEFERDPEEDIRTGEAIESQAERARDIRETPLSDIVKGAGEEALAPIKLDIPEEDFLPEGFGQAEEAPDIEEQRETAKAEEPPKPEPEEEEEPEGFGKEIEKEGEEVAEKGIEKEGEEEAAAAALPGLGEVAFAAVGVGQLISSLVDRHKQNQEEHSMAAAQMNAQAQPSVALDPSPTFDSTFR